MLPCELKKGTYKWGPRYPAWSWPSELWNSSTDRYPRRGGTKREACSFGVAFTELKRHVDVKFFVDGGYAGSGVVDTPSCDWEPLRSIYIRLVDGAVAY